jgi:predicted nucleic acid-binding protein
MMRWPLPNDVEQVVINTGPLITLGRAGALAMIEQLPIRFIAPPQVAEEIGAGAAAGHPVVLPTWVEVLALTVPLAPLACQALDAGEAAVIQLALERGIPTVCIDEWRGRRAAKAVGLRVTGSLGLLGRAKQAGLIPAVRPWVERLAAAGAHYDPELLQGFLQAMSESSVNNSNS